MKARAGFRADRGRLGLPGFRRGAAVALPGGQIEPAPEITYPAVSTAQATPKRYVTKKGALPSDTITFPAATAGSKLILELKANGTAAFNTPTGYTAITGYAHTTGPAISQAGFEKNAAGGETSIAWTMASGTATAVTASLVEVQDANAATITAAKSVTNAGTATRATGSPGGTTTHEGTLALSFAGVQAGASVDATTARGFSGGFTTAVFTASVAAAPAVAMGTKQIAASGEAVSTEWTWTGDAADENLLGLVLIRSATGAAAVASAYRYLRVYITDSESSQYSGLEYVEFRSAAGVAKPVVSSANAFASSVFSGQPAAFAFQNNTAYWLAGNNLAEPSYVGFDHGASGEGGAFAPVQLVLREPSGTGIACAPLQFRVEGSNDATIASATVTGGTWATIYTSALQAAWASGETRLFSLA